MTQRINVDDFYKVPHDQTPMYDNEGKTWFYMDHSLPTPVEPEPMTDTPTTAQPKPLLEPTDMAMIPDLLARVANTIVAASDFASKLTEMTAKVNQLDADLDQTRRTNTVLQETIDSISAQRDEAQATVKSQTDSLLRAAMDKNKLEDELNSATRDRDSVYAQMADVKAERDNYGMRNLELEDELAKTKAKLAKFQRVFEETMEDAKPTSQPEPEYVDISSFLPPANTEVPKDEPVNTGWQPDPEPTPVKPTETDLGYYNGHEKFAYYKASGYDAERGEWFVPREAVA